MLFFPLGFFFAHVHADKPGRNNVRLPITFIYLFIYFPTETSVRSQDEDQEEIRSGTNTKEFVYLLTHTTPSSWYRSFGVRTSAGSKCHSLKFVVCPFLFSLTFTSIEHLHVFCPGSCANQTG